MKLGEMTSVVLAQHNSIAILLNAALGDGKKGAPLPSIHNPNVKNLAEGHGSVDDAVRAINQAMTI